MSSLPLVLAHLLLLHAIIADNEDEPSNSSIHRTAHSGQRQRSEDVGQVAEEHDVDGDVDDSNEETSFFF